MGIGGDGKGVVFAFDGQSWNKQFETADGTIGVVAAADPSHVWAVGTNESGANVYFFDGATWAVQFQANIHVQDMCALDPSHVWLVAEDREGKSAVYFFDGASWTKKYEPPSGELLLGISAADPGHVWAVGSAPASSGGAEHLGGSVFYFDGSTWTKQYQTVEELHRATAADPKHVWATGGIGKTGPIYFFDGNYWRKQFSANEALFDISAADGRNAWAVGGLAGIYTFEDEGPGPGPSVRRHCKEWVRAVSPPSWSSRAWMLVRTISGAAEFSSRDTART